MAETSLRGRPSFSTFLRSDTNTGGDGLTYYDYQRFLRSQKVALLQERRAHANVPGYKKVIIPTSRKVFQLKTKSPVYTTDDTASTSTRPRPANEPLKPDHVSTTRENPTALACSDHGAANKTLLSLSPAHASSSQVNVTRKLKHIETEKLPWIPAHRHRLTKSATARDHCLTWPSSELQNHPPRPKTVASSRDVKIQTADNEDSDKKCNPAKEGIFAWCNLLNFSHIITSMR